MTTAEMGCRPVTPEAAGSSPVHRAKDSRYLVSKTSERDTPAGTNAGTKWKVASQLRLLATFFVSIVVSACAPWAPSDFPVRVDVGADLNEQQRVALLDGIALLEERVGANVFAPVETNGRRIQRGRISVRNGVEQHDEAGHFDPTHWSCRITLRRDIYPEIALHELLHCLGLDHDHADDSVMGEYVGSNLTREHVDFVRGLMGLGPSVPTEVAKEVPPEVPEGDVPNENANDEVPVEEDAGVEIVEDAGVSLPDFTIPNIRVNLGAAGGAR